MTAAVHVTSLAAARPVLREIWRSGQALGSVHTLGALHEGHGKLIELAARENEHAVVTIYPNKIQLFPGTRYEYAIEDDVALARRHGATMVISTTDGEMYPPGYCTFVDQGVAHRQLNSSVFDFATRGQVTGAVRWINFTRPTRSYFGMKDIEQALMVEYAIADLLIDCEIRQVPCVRMRSSGVPISSRLRELGADRLAEIGMVYSALELGRELVRAGETDPKAVTNHMREYLSARLRTFSIRYITVVDVNHLLPVHEIAVPFVLHCAITDGTINHFDGLCIRSAAELEASPEVIWLDDDA